jgi:hypothetical protein
MPYIILFKEINSSLYFIAGQAVGFRLDSLLKLIETRSTNSRTTLMHFLCKVWR